MRLFLCCFSILLVACGSQASPARQTTTTLETAAPSASTTSAPAPSTTEAADAGVDAAARREMLNRLRDELERLHPNPYWRVGEGAFAAELASVSDRAGDLDDDAFTLEVIRLGALIDGHTAAYPTEPWDTSGIHLYRLDDGVFVVDAADPDVVGAEVLAIEGLPVEEAWRAMSVYASYDGPPTRELATPNFLRTPRALAAAGLSESTTAITYQLETPAGERLDYTPPVGAREDSLGVGLPVREDVEWLRLLRTPIWFEYRDVQNIVYVQYNRMASGTIDPVTGERARMSDVADAIETLLAEHPASRLVVDIRHNPGGNNGTFGPIRDLMIERAAVDACAAALIIGRQTFSAAANFAAVIDTTTDIRLYGEETGGSPNLYGDVHETSLVDIGIRVAISTRYWEFSSPDDARDAVNPDVPVPLTSADLARGHDPVLAAVLDDPACIS